MRIGHFPRLLLLDLSGLQLTEATVVVRVSDLGRHVGMICAFLHDYILLLLMLVGSHWWSLVDGLAGHCGGSCTRVFLYFGH